MSLRRHVRVALVLPVLLVVTACGSTVRGSGTAVTSQLGAGTGGAGPGLGIASPPPATSLPPRAGAAAAPGPNSVGIGAVHGSGTTGGPVGEVGPGAGAPTASIPDKGPGWDRHAVYIGLVEIRDSTTAMQSAGLKSVATGDQEQQGNALASYLNAHGGVLGRKIVMVYDNHANANVQAQPEVEAQASCAKFTRDQRVAGVINTQTGIDTPSYRDCLSKAGIPLFGVSISPIDDSALAAARNLFYPVIVPTWNRFAPVFAARLKALDYFHGWDTNAGGPGTAPVKVGAYIHDDPASEVAYQLAAAAFAKVGYAPALVFRWSNYNDASNAVLQFRSAGITHVFSLDAAEFLFATQAEAQRYRPRYAVQTGNGPGVAMEANAPAAQNVGALGVGTSPMMDINHEVGDITPGGGTCRAIYSAAGQGFQGAYFTQAFAYSICDSMRALAAGFTRGHGFTQQAFRAGLGSIGPTFQPAMTFGSGLTSSYPVFPGAGRDLGWRTSCNCYEYLSSTPRRF